MTQLAPSNYKEPSSQNPTPPQPNPPKRRPKKLWLLMAIALAVAAGVGLKFWLFQPDKSALELSGRIEGYDTDLGSKTGGRIESVAVREGDRVKKGQVIARLDDQELNAELAAAKASKDSAQEKVNQARSQLAVIQSQIQEARLTLRQSEGQTVGRVNEAEATVATAQAQFAEAQAQVRQAESQVRLAQLERDRYQSLAKDGAVSQQRADQAQTEYETAQDTLGARRASLVAASRQVKASEGGLTQAQTTQFDPDIRTAQVTRLQRQLEQANAELAAAEAEVKRAIANQNEVEARLANLEIVSPIDGIVVTRMVEPGEVISTGTAVMTVINLSQVYLRGYIPEGEVGQVHVGQAAQVFLDSAPDRPLEAKVTAIDTEASFTPENIYFRDDRVNQVFGVRMGIQNPDGLAKPGMPADGKILLSDAQE